MSTQALLDKITAATTEQVADIKAKAAAQVEAINASATAEVDRIKADAAAATEKDVAQIKRAALAKARQTGKLAVQTARREVFDTIMAAAEVQVVGDDAVLAQQFADRRADLEMQLAKQIG